MSYDTVFSLGPLLALLVLLAGVIWDPKDVQGAIEVQIRDLIGPEASSEVLAMVAHWNVEPDPAKGGIQNFIKKRVFSFGLILAIVFLLIASLAVTAAVSALSRRVAVVCPKRSRSR